MDFTKVFYLWLLENWKITSGELSGEPYSFKDHLFLEKIAQDNHNYIVVKKSSQCGLSELNVARTIFYADTRKGNIFYGFPAARQLEDFVDSRVRPVFDTPYFNKNLTGACNLSRIEYKKNFIFFRGCQNTRQIKSIDANALILDEVDEMDEDTISVLGKRLGHAKDPIKQFLSTPSYPEIGIDFEFLNSNQNEWHIKCSHCNKIQFLTWDGNVINYGTVLKPEPVICCAYCRKRINIKIDSIGWIPLQPSHDTIHGYHISKLLIPNTDLTQLWIDSQNPVREQSFRNHDLGECHQPRGSRLTKEIVMACTNGDYHMPSKSDDICSMGVDVGKVLHVRISKRIGIGKRMAIFIGTVNWDILPQLFDKYKVATCVIDAYPDTTKAKELQEKFPDRVFLAYYPNGMKDLYTIGDGCVNIDRTQAMCIIQNSFQAGHIMLPLGIDNIYGYIDQIITPVRAVKEDINGNIVTFFPKLNKPDHYFHAEVYDMIASEMSPHKVTFFLRGLFR